MDWLWLLIAVLRSGSPEPADQWAATLAGLDHARAEAFAAAEPRLLDGVYVHGSAAQRADAAMITDYDRRGGRVEDAELRILSCRVVEESGSRVRLDVVDRLDSDATVQWRDGSTSSLPDDQPSRRVVTLAHTAEGWRIAGTRVTPRR